MMLRGLMRVMVAGIAVGLCRGSSPALNTSMIRTAEPQHGPQLIGRGRIGSSGSGASGAASSRFAGEREVASLHAACEQTVVADAVEASGQHVIRNWRMNS
jgi:hypothetical protein